MNYEFKKFVLLAQKEQSEITLYQKEENDHKLVLKDSVILGENQGDKYTEGDKKTPEGSYDLVEKRTNVDSFYGPFALVTSYPNIFDQSLDKKGSGIWIHGMPFNMDREKFTKGCIALNNSELENLEKSLEVLPSIGDGYKVLMSLYNKKRADSARSGDDNGIDYYMNKMDDMRQIAKITTLKR